MTHVLVLENAYKNYTLIDKDKSPGSYNPGYALKLLRDSLRNILNYYR